MLRMQEFQYLLTPLMVNGQVTMLGRTYQRIMTGRRIRAGLEAGAIMKSCDVPRKLQRSVQVRATELLKDALTLSQQITKKGSVTWKCQLKYNQNKNKTTKKGRKEGKNEEDEKNEEEETSDDESDDDEEDVDLYTNRVLHNLSLQEVDKLIKSLKKEDLLKTVLVRERQRDFHPLISLMDAYDVVCVNANRAMSMRSIVTQVRPKPNNGSTDAMLGLLEEIERYVEIATDIYSALKIDEINEDEKMAILISGVNGTKLIGSIREIERYRNILNMDNQTKVLYQEASEYLRDGILSEQMDEALQISSVNDTQKTIIGVAKTNGKPTKKKPISDEMKNWIEKHGKKCLACEKSGHIAKDCRSRKLPIDK